MYATTIIFAGLSFPVVCFASALDCKLNPSGLLHVGRLDLLQAKLRTQKGLPGEGQTSTASGDDVKQLATKYDLTDEQTDIAASNELSAYGRASESLKVRGKKPPPQKIEKYKVYQMKLPVVEGEGQLIIFLNALLVHGVLLVFFLTAFSLLRKLCPSVYQRHSSGGSALTARVQGLFGWVSDSLAVKFDDVAEQQGLDQALMLEYTRVCMRLLRTIALLIFFGMGSFNFMFGGMAAGKDILEYNAYSNVQADCWVHWLHAFSVWIVVLVVQEQLYNAQQAFLTRRFNWLRHLSEPRATSVLVEGIPDEYQTDEKFKGFFETMFGHGKVKAAYLAKRAPLLEAAYARKLLADKGIKSASFKWDKVGRDPARRPTDRRHGDLIDYWTKELSEADAAVKSERQQAKNLMQTPGGVNGCNGFVTFHNTTDAEIALSVTCGADKFDWEVSSPPTPHGVLWHDLEQDPVHATFYNALGYLLTGGLYMIFLPCVLWCTDCAKHLEHKVWAAILPPLTLQAFISTAPTLLRWIFKHCFTLNGHGFSQQLLQMWFWNFQVVFVILVPAMGGNFWAYVKDVVTSPVKVFYVLGATLPSQTHFFLNYAVMIWTTRVLELIRYSNLAKYLWFSRNYPPGVAKDMSEPEDADYYGLGSRYARMTIMMNISIIFSALCPTIIFLVLADFALCRLVYGYLIPFVETKKPDSGGHYWVKGIEHISVGALFYCIVMTGVLYGTASTPGPAIISACCFPFLMYSMWRFENEFLWEKLPFHEHRAKEAEEKRPHDGVYMQPEWIEEGSLEIIEALPDQVDKDLLVETQTEPDSMSEIDLAGADDEEPARDAEMQQLEAEVALLQAKLSEAGGSGSQAPAGDL
mmetsp:Transcript_46916/g.84767  ORF Transcript_46916/g.84767 Transcript_46916/m.84767 type:complete len:864 (+) Transcript_46916:62-2653(+)